MSDAPDRDEASRSENDPVAGNPEGLPDVYGEDPDDKKPLVEREPIDGDD